MQAPEPVTPPEPATPDGTRPFMERVIGWIVELPLFRPPPGMATEPARRFRALCALIATSVVIDVFLAAVFFALGLPLLALTALASLGVFAFALGRVHAGRVRLGFWIGYLDVFVHITFLTVVLGPASGFPLYGLCMAMATFLATSRRQVGARLIATALALALLSLALPAWDGVLVPLADVEAEVMSLLFSMNLLGVAFGLVAATAWFGRLVSTAQAETERERQRSERLLRNILPDAIAHRLKDGEENIADHFDSVSVLFADIVGFTRLSVKKRTPDLIEMLNHIFSEFDALADRYGLEKIKTIGDAYMVVSGLPVPRPDHADALAEMALDMRSVMQAYAGRTGEDVDIRIGVHSGPVVAGVIGRRKFAYDLWGDTVNVASRMESHGEPGRVQISDETRRLIDDRFDVRGRGTIDVKGRGPMATYWLEGRATHETEADVATATG